MQSKSYLDRGVLVRCGALDHGLLGLPLNLPLGKGREEGREDSEGRQDRQPADREKLDRRKRIPVESRGNERREKRWRRAKS